MGKADERRVDALFSYFDLNPPAETIQRYAEVLKSINNQPEDLAAIKRGIFVESEIHEMQVEKSVPIFSYCEHHILPWFGVVHLGYIADGKVIGLSKFTRIVRYFSVGLTLQEIVTHNIAEFLVENVSPHVMVMVEALHTCKVSRGVQNPFSRSITIAARGVFKEDSGPRVEFFEALKVGER